MTTKECVICGAVGDELHYDEFMDAYVCSTCDVKRELGGVV